MLGTGFYLVVYDVNQLPIVGDPQTAPIDSVVWHPDICQIQLPTINGIKYSGACIYGSENKTAYEELTDWLTANNLYLDTESNYYGNLDIH